MAVTRKGPAQSGVPVPSSDGGCGGGADSRRPALQMRGLGLGGVPSVLMEALEVAALGRTPPLCWQAGTWARRCGGSRSWVWRALGPV